MTFKNNIKRYFYMSYSATKIRFFLHTTKIIKVENKNLNLKSLIT